MTQSELSVLADQLDELLASGIEDPDEALEVAALAGMMARLDDQHPALATADDWRCGLGAALLDEAWDLLDTTDFVDAIEAVATEAGTDEAVEEALLDFDELAAAAAWCGRADRVAAASAEVESLVRLVPEVFASMAPWGRELARLPSTVAQLELYAFWLAVADAADVQD